MKTTMKTSAKIPVSPAMHSTQTQTNCGLKASARRAIDSVSDADEAPMTMVELIFFKDLLLQQRSEILNKADAFKAEAAVENSAQGDEGDLAVSELSLSISLRLQERQAQHLQKIDHALSKIDDGTFGLCEQCDEPLNINRLKARPVATLCIACKEEQENKERVHA